MNLSRTVILVVVAVVIGLVYSSFFVVDEREKVLVIRFGPVKRIITEPGLYAKIPFIEDLVRVEDRVVFFESVDKEVQVVDGRRYLVDSIAMIRIVDPQKFREAVQASMPAARQRIDAILDAALRRTYGKRTFDSALSQDRASMMREIRDQVRQEALTLGVEVVDVRIRRTDLLPEVLKDTYDRMSAERFAEAAELRAVGQAEAARIKAEADRQSAEILAKANQESEIIRGEGDAERNKLFADAFLRDPEFFAFYRSMQAYAKSLSDSGTTLVLKPDSEFFRYFSGSGGEVTPRTASPNNADEGGGAAGETTPPAGGAVAPQPSPGNPVQPTPTPPGGANAPSSPADGVAAQQLGGNTDGTVQPQQ